MWLIWWNNRGSSFFLKHGVYLDKLIGSSFQANRWILWIFGGSQLPPPKKRKIPNFFAPQGRTPCLMMVKSVGFMQKLVVDVCCDLVGKLGIYRQKTVMGHFPPKNLESASSKTTGPIEKIKGVQKWYGHLLSSCQVWCRWSLHRGVRKKSWSHLHLDPDPWTLYGFVTIAR